MAVITGLAVNGLRVKAVWSPLLFLHSFLNAPGLSVLVSQARPADVVVIMSSLETFIAEFGQFCRDRDVERVMALNAPGEISGWSVSEGDAYPS